MIRFLVGFLVVFGSVGGIDSDPNANLMLLVCTAVIGLAIMAWGVEDLKQK